MTSPVTSRRNRRSVVTGFDLRPLCGPAADERVAAIEAGLSNGLI